MAKNELDVISITTINRLIMCFDERVDDDDRYQALDATQMRTALEHVFEKLTANERLILSRMSDNELDGLMDHIVSSAKQKSDGLQINLKSLKKWLQDQKTELQKSDEFQMKSENLKSQIIAFVMLCGDMVKDMQKNKSGLGAAAESLSKTYAELNHELSMLNALNDKLLKKESSLLKGLAGTMQELKKIPREKSFKVITLHQPGATKLHDFLKKSSEPKENYDRMMLAYLRLPLEYQQAYDAMDEQLRKQHTALLRNLYQVDAFERFKKFLEPEVKRLKELSAEKGIELKKSR